MKRISLSEIETIVTHSSDSLYIKQIVALVKEAEQKAIKEGKTIKNVRFYISEDGKIVAKV